MPQNFAHHQSESGSDGDWIRHHEAAQLMHVNEKLLRIRNSQTGAYLHWPNLRRIRPLRSDGTPGKFIFLLRSEVTAWIIKQEQVAETVAPGHALSVFEHLRESFADKPHLSRQLGLQ